MSKDLVEEKELLPYTPYEPLNKIRFQPSKHSYHNYSNNDLSSKNDFSQLKQREEDNILNNNNNLSNSPKFRNSKRMKLKEQVTVDNIKGKGLKDNKSKVNHLNIKKSDETQVPRSKKIGNLSGVNNMGVGKLSWKIGFIFTYSNL